ncbi:MAG: PAS domain-containing protein [Firmicutes bacterium]|nr:PAS domain-containing protein [Bacillota bacterium]
MVLDVLTVLAGHGVDIQAMEAEPGAIYLRFPRSQYRKEIERQINSLSGVYSIEPITSLPQEKRQQEIGAIVESVSEGLIAIDAVGKITLFNRAAEKILQISASNVLGQYVGDVLSVDVPMLRTLKTGRGYDNQQMSVKIAGKRTRYLTSGRPLVDDLGVVLGAVASIKDISQVRALVHSVTRSPEITFDNIIFRSRMMAEVVDLARRIAASDATVLIQGESGTGKELFARALHAASPRRDLPFVPINCAALPDSLLESELFGYEDGAFTGARRGGRMGLFELAHGGTIFLDEIGEMPTHLQAKLLRVLQSGAFRRVGGNEEIDVDMRIITATNQDLRALVQQQKFREDLYYRLNVIPLFIPPLAQRREDIRPLLEHFLRLHQTEISVEGVAVLEAHSWPGNVRELENVLERAVAMAAGGKIGPEHLLLEADAVPESVGNLRAQVEALEKRVLTAALSKYRSSRRAGEALGLSHTSVLNKVKKYALERYLSNWNN